MSLVLFVQKLYDLMKQSMIAFIFRILYNIIVHRNHLLFLFYHMHLNGYIVYRTKRVNICYTKRKSR